MPCIPLDRHVVADVMGSDLTHLGLFYARRLAPEHLRLDAAQSFVLAALRAARNARPDVDPLPYVIKSGVGGILNMVRAERRQRAASLDAAIGVADADGDLRLGDTVPDPKARPPDARRIKAETARAVRAAVDSLPTRERAVAVGVLLEDRSAADVAEEIGKARQTVYRRLGLAVGRLKKRLAGCAT